VAYVLNVETPIKWLQNGWHANRYEKVVKNLNPKIMAAIAKAKGAR
jgi:hypothetical protein